MCCDGQPSGDDCKCLAYKDPLFMTAQALSIVGFFISWGYGAIFGLIAFILLQVAWCCKMNKCGLLVAGVFACIAAAGTIAVGGYSLVLADDYSDDFYSSSTNQAYFTVGILGLIGGCIWITVATLIFIFVCGRRFRKYESNSDDGNNKNQQSDDNLPVVTIPTTTANQEPMKPVAVNHVKAVVPMARSAVVDAFATSKMNDNDAESWTSEAETVVDTERQSKKKSDGTTVDTEIQTFTHRDSTKSSVKTVRLSKKLDDGSVKEQVTVFNTDAKGKEIKTVEKNRIPADANV